MSITASIVAYHTDSAELRSALRLLSGSEVQRIYVIDNAADSETALLCADFNKAVYIPSSNRGYGAGHNIALRVALDSGTDYHLVMNSDVTFTPEALLQIGAYMDAHPDVGAVQPKIVNPDGSLQFTVRRIPAPIDLIGRRFIPCWKHTRRNYWYEMRDLDHERSFEASVFQGSFMFLRCDALRRVGLFDERFFMYPEDIDLTRRIHEHYLTMYIPEPVVIHNHRRASYRSLRMLAIHCVNMIRYFNKWGWFNDSGRH